MAARSIAAYNLGRMRYDACLRLQKHLLERQLAALVEPANVDGNGSASSAASSGSTSEVTPTSPHHPLDSLLLVEHEPTYTIGIRRDKYSEADLARLRSLGAHVTRTDRGGLITFHGPGQLVAYPILNLKNYSASLKWYVTRLEQTVIDACKAAYGLDAHRLCKLGYTGVWCRDAKVAALGVHCKRYITYHGLALNCDVDLAWFDHIVPCGIDDRKVTSLTRLLGRTVDVADAIPHVVSAFERNFNAAIRMQSAHETQLLKDTACS